MDTKQLDQFNALAAHIHHGGQFANYWELPNKRTHWHPVGQNGRVPVGTNVYFGVHPTTEIPTTDEKGNPKKPMWLRSRKDIIASIRCVFAEWDAKDFGDSKDTALAHVEALPLRPSAVWDSGGGYQGAWLLDEPFDTITPENRERADRLQKAWVDWAGGDDGAKDLARVLRVPGTTNGKYEPPRPVTFLWCDLDNTFSLDDLESYLGLDQPTQSESVIVPDTMSERLVNSAQGEGLDDEHKYAIAVFYQRLRDIRSTAKGSRHPIILRAAQRLGVLVGAGLLNELTVTTALIQAAETIGKTNAEAAHVVADGIVWGKKQIYVPPPKLASLVKREDTRREYLPTAETQFTDEDKKLADFKPDDDGNADAFISVFGKRYSYTMALGWQRWTGTHYRRQDADAAVVIDMITVLRKRQAAAALVNRPDVIKAAQPSRKNIDAAISLLQKKLRAAESDFDTHPDLLNVRNGVVNLRTGEVTPHDPDLKITHYIDVDYKKDAEMQLVVDFLLQVVKGGMQVVKWLQMWLGYCMTGETHIEQMLYLWGAARAGKGTLMEAIADLLGEVLVQAVNFATFAEKRDPDSQNFDLAVLRAARFVIADESPRAGNRNKLDPEKIKKITGGGRITCSFKHRDQFTYKPRFKIAIISNFPLNADVDDDAMWGRVNIVELPNSHLGKEDLRIKQNFKTRRYQEALLAWLVDGSMLMYQLGNSAATSPAAMSSDKEHTRDMLDNVGQWLEECAEKIEGADAPLMFVTNGQLRASYEQWCKNNGHLPQSARRVTQTLQRRSFGVGDVKKLEGRTERIITGIRIIR